MNILLYGSAFPPVPYGVSRYFGNLGQALIRRGHAVAAVTARMPDRPEREDWQGIQVFRIAPARAMPSQAAAQTALRIAREWGADLIQGVDYLGECASLLRQRDRPPLCVKLSTSISLRTLRRSLALFPWQRLMVNLACARAWRQWRNELISIRRADLLFAPTRRVFEEFQRQGTPLPTRRAVVPNPVTVPADWHNDEDREPTVLFVGRLDFGKGVGRLPSIMSALWKQLPQTRLTIAGGDFYARGIGSVRAWLTKRFGSFTHRVHFAGEVGATELDELYRRAWIVVVPSRWDSCSNATLEAMARAKAVVASPHGGMAELLEGTAAPVADPDRPDFAAAAARLLSEKSQRQALGRALQRQAGERFHPDRVAELYCQFTAREIGGAA